jgi:hypothetical protein
VRAFPGLEFDQTLVQGQCLARTTVAAQRKRANRKPARVIRTSPQRAARVLLRQNVLAAAQMLQGIGD